MFTIHSFKNKNGFTLLEVLLSLTLIFLIVFPLFRFFLQAYDYTMDSRNKTIAVNIARNVVNYMEKQNIFVMKTYLDDKKGSNKFVTLNWENCFDVNHRSIDANGKPVFTNSKESKINDFPLFTSGVDQTGNKIADGSICSSVLAPVMNNSDNYKDQIKVYLTDYYDDKAKNEELINLLKSEKESSVIAVKIKDILSGSPKYETQLIKIYVAVDWNEKRDNIVLEGVISDEAFR